MLVLTRRKGEILMIGNDIKIKVLGTCGHGIKIGIDAPKDIQIYREEIYQRIQLNKH